MAESYSIKNLENELSVINFEDMDTTAEVKLAAEIGQFLLERNKLLESTLEKNQQLIVEQQSEINKLVKQSNYLQDANNSSQKISEQLEQSLLDLERSNQQLIKQRSTDQDMLKELNERKDFLEQRCENLEESYEYIEERLTKAQSRMNICDNVVLTTVSISSDSVIEVEPTSLPFSDIRITERLDYLSTDLTDTKYEIATYNQRMEKLEAQLAMLLQKNMELEDVIASRRSPMKSRTTTSGCSSDKNKNSTSLAEELEAAKMSHSLESFAGGCFVTSTPPKTKSPMKSDTVIDMTYLVDEIVDNASSIGKQNKEKKSKLRRAAYLKRQLSAVSTPTEEYGGSSSEQKVRINVCIDIDPDQRRDENRLCRQHRLKCFARTVVLAYKETILKGLSKILGPFVRQPRNYLGTLILWTNKKWIERNIRIM